jgi:hypothetical protein
MTARLDRVLKREVLLRGEPYTLTIAPDGVKITRKGARKGHEITWEALVSGDAELRRDLNISIDAYRG